MGARAVLLVFLSAALACAANAEAADPTVWVRAPDGAIEETRWYEVRAADRLKEHLELLHLQPVERAPSTLDVEVASKPRVVKRTRDTVQLTLKARRGKTRETFEVKGRAGRLDELTAELALKLAAWAKVPVPKDAAARFPAWRYPYSVHRFLGRAAVRVRRADYRQAAVMYGRAQELVKSLWVPEAFEGRHRAAGYLIAQGEQAANAKRDLAASAAERAVVAKKNAAAEDELAALEAFLRYTPDRALRWRRRLDMSAGVVLGDRSVWMVQPRPNVRWDLDPRTGVALHTRPGAQHAVAVVQEDVLTLDGRTLRRVQPEGTVRWTVRMPAEAGPQGVVSTSGLFGVLAASSVAWADVSIGELGQVARGVRPLASGVGGVVVSLRAKDDSLEVALLRPGKKTPAWQTAIKGHGDTRLTRDRVLLVTAEGLMLLRSHDGKPAGKTLPLGAQPRMLGAGGRFAALAEEGSRVAIIDILAVERTATVQGPGPALAAVPAGQGVAVLFETGDLIFFDRDGRILDRAWLPGRPRQLWVGSPVVPGPVVGTDRGLFAVANVAAEPGLQRDVDATLAAAERLWATGNTQAALRLANHLSLRSVGRVGEAESLRCRILTKLDKEANAAAIQRAMRRAKRAADPTQSLGPFEF